MMKTSLPLLLCSFLLPPSAGARTQKEYIPAVHGTVRAKYEYEPPVGKGRFEIRNARLSVDGKVVPVVSYKAEIDLSDEGRIRMLDTYVRLQPKNWRLTLGQMRVPFTLDAHRSPHLQFFANRSFIAKQVGNVRDVGAAVAWTPRFRVPVTVEGGIFNGSGLTEQKDFWTSDYNFSFKVQTLLARQFGLTLSCQKANAGDVHTMMYDIGAYWEASGWHVEGEFLRKSYARGAFSSVNAVDAFVVYRRPLKKGPAAISFLGRYDYMSDHSKGNKGTDGKLKTDDPERHRLTGGVTLSFGTPKLRADVRLNYEQYFYRKNAVPALSEQNKCVAELVVVY